MINLYIFMTVLIGFLILLSIKFTIFNPSDINQSNNSNYNSNYNSITNANKPILDYYGKYGNIQRYSDYDYYNNFNNKC